jgi:signal transduction histidine kinase
VTITRRILLQVAIATVAVITVATATSYYFVRRNAESRAISFLYDYVAERGRVQEAQLKRVEQNLHMVRELFLDRDARPVTTDVENQWRSRNELSPDGAWRTRREGFDPRRRSSMWVSSNAPMTFALKTRVLRAENILNDFILGWVDDFPSLYFIFPQQVNIGYDARIPNWVWQAKADYDTCAEAYFQDATPERNPEGRIVWGAAVREPVSQVPYVNVTLPIQRGKEFIGIVGHDIAVSDLLASTARPGLQGVTTFLMRRDGRLIAHPDIQQRILDSNGTLTMDQTGDPALRAIYQGSQIIPKEQDLFGGSLENNTVHFAAVQWESPAWLFVGVLSYDQLRADAFRSARWVLWSGLGSLALVLGLFTWILRRQVAEPLAELARATRRMSAGDATARATVARADELGALARSFNEMAARVAERDTALRAEKAMLEQRVTERTQALQTALVREQELGELKTRFVSMVSHEFRTPLEVIVSSADILDRYLDRLPAAERAEHVAAIQHAVKRMSGMMEDVLLLGRFESDRQQFSPDDLHLKALCRRLADEMRSATAGKCPIELTLDDALPLARADEKLLRHILTNLLSNAVKYSAAGAPVRFTVAREGNAAVLRVSDSGLGIPAADQSRLFEAFHRGGNTDQIPGTGLGLVIVKRSVELHGGTIEFSSEEGKGTTFIVRLPVFNPTET